jgi:ABC-type antimicrobial peptide transport system permease subunit
MRFTNTLRVALRALRRNTMRSMLTALGMIIGVAAVITMVSIANAIDYNNIYIHATNLGNYNTIGCQNERTIVKKVPVSADRGMQIFDQCVLTNHYFSN